MLLDYVQLGFLVFSAIMCGISGYCLNRSNAHISRAITWTTFGIVFITMFLSIMVGDLGVAFLALCTLIFDALIIISLNNLIKRERIKDITEEIFK